MTNRPFNRVHFENTDSNSMPRFIAVQEEGQFLHVKLFNYSCKDGNETFHPPNGETLVTVMKGGTTSIQEYGFTSDNKPFVTTKRVFPHTPQPLGDTPTS